MAMALSDANAPLLGGNARRPDQPARSWSIIPAVTMAIVVLLVVRSKRPEFKGLDEVKDLSPLVAACAATFYPETCKETLLPKNHSNPEEWTRILVARAAQGVTTTLTAVLENRGDAVCLETLVSSVEELEASLTVLNASPYPFDELKVRLSAAMEFHTTCIDALTEIGALEPLLTNVHKLLSNALAFVNALSRFGTDVMSWEQTDSTTLGLLNPLGSDSWMSSEHDNPPVDVVVAQDGSGNFQSIQAAIDAAPRTAAKRYVIRIKAGVYDEQVRVPKRAKNFMFIGDGAENSIITGNKSVTKTFNTTTFSSGSLIVEGDGFIGKGFTARNTAGAEGHQAVAMRVDADKAVFHNCTFDGFQDTLYAHTKRQFYRECTVQGTIDFIFGNGAVAFQSCTLVAKKSPLAGQTNVYTAQGKADRGQSTGLSFQSCKFDATPELKAATATMGTKTFLGRPWRPFSTHVNLKCEVMGHIDAAGWLPWNSGDVGISTAFFAEWQDFGPGAAASNIAQRVAWSKQIADVTDAAAFQAVTFTQADQWVPATGVPLSSSLP